MFGPRLPTRALSLGALIADHAELARRGEVTPLVPAEVIARVGLMDLLTETPQAVETVLAAQAALEAAGDVMWRTDLSSPLPVKAMMGTGEGRISPVHLGHVAGDDRVLGTHLSQQEETVTIYRRPRLTLQTVPVRPDCPVPTVPGAVFPVEYRAFVTPEHVTISAYYPQGQAELAPLSAAHEAAIRRDGRAMHGVIGGEVPAFSLDFAVDAAGTLWMLERGPTMNEGGHPCCLEHTRALDGRVALIPESGAWAGPGPQGEAE